MLVDAETGKEISIVDITSTEDEYWTKWKLINDTGYPARYEIILPDNISIITKVPDVLTVGEVVILDVRINIVNSFTGTIKIIPHITEARIS